MSTAFLISLHGNYFCLLVYFGKTVFRQTYTASDIKKSCYEIIIVTVVVVIIFSGHTTESKYDYLIWTHFAWIKFFAIYQFFSIVAKINANLACLNGSKPLSHQNQFKWIFLSHCSRPFPNEFTWGDNSQTREKK